MLMTVPEVQRKEFESLYYVVGALGLREGTLGPSLGCSDFQRERGMKLESRSKAPGYQLPAWGKGEVWSEMDLGWEGLWK